MIKNYFTLFVALLLIVGNNFVEASQSLTILYTGETQGQIIPHFI